MTDEHAQIVERAICAARVEIGDAHAESEIPAAWVLRRIHKYFMLEFPNAIDWASPWINPK